MSGVRVLNPLELSPTPFYLVFEEISRKIKDHCKTDEEIKKRLSSFLEPGSLENVPFIRILAMIFATLAHRLSSGNMNKSKMKASFYTDAMIVATLLPFCDAIFIEKQMAGFLRDRPLNSVLERMPRVFSLSNKTEFLKYLDDIERCAPQGHKDIVAEVYGDDWGRPFCSVLEKKFN